MSARCRSRWIVTASIVCAATLYPSLAAGQQRPPTVAPPPPRQQIVVRGFGDFGATKFTAADTFEAILGSSTGVWFGGGGEVILPSRFFVNVRVSRFQKNGERVFVFNDEVFPLGIEETVRITPIEITGGYRFPAQGRTRRTIPYVGGGLGWHRYDETSDFADSSDDVSATIRGYHFLGGVEFRLGRLFGVGGEAQWTTVPDALGDAPSGASEMFGETNLGGLGFRVRFVVGR